MRSFTACMLLKTLLTVVRLAFKATTSWFSRIIEQHILQSCVCFVLPMICQDWFLFLENKLSACRNDSLVPHSYSQISGKNLAGINLIPLASCWQTHQKDWKRCHNLWLCKYLNRDCSEANCRADDNVALLYYISNRFDRWIWMLISHE